MKVKIATPKFVLSQLSPEINVLIPEIMKWIFLLWKWLCYPVSLQHLGFIAALCSALKKVSSKLFPENATNIMYLYLPGQTTTGLSWKFGQCPKCACRQTCMWMEWHTHFFQNWKRIIYETDSLFSWAKGRNNPLSFIPHTTKKPSCSKIKFTLFHPPDQKVGKKRKLLLFFFFLRKNR